MELNSRERARFAAAFRELSELAAKLAYAIETGEDNDMVKDFLFFSLRLLPTKEFGDIIAESIIKTGVITKDDFPDTIFTK